MGIHCVACGDFIDKQKAARVPKDITKRARWAEIFGKEFEMNCTRYRCPYIRLAHFKDGKHSRKNLPCRLPTREPDVTEQEHWVWKREESPKKSSPTVFDQLQEDQISESNESLSSATVDESVLSMSDDDECHVSEKPQRYKYIFCRTDNIVRLLRKCNKCGNSNTKIEIIYIGLSANITVSCEQCVRKWFWSNTKICETKKTSKMEKLKEIHIDFTASILLSGNGYQSIRGMFGVLETPIFSVRTYNRLKAKYIYPAVGIKYNEEIEFVKELMMTRARENELLNIVGDGSYDSRGHSALFCRYVCMEAETKFVVNYDIAHRKTNESKYDMEKVACERGFGEVVRRLTDGEGNSVVASFTTDRSKSITTLIKQRFPTIDHFFDSWHFIRGIALEVFKKRGQKQFEPLANWCRSFINHLHWCISESQGNGPIAKERLLSFFLHVSDIHSHFEKCDWHKFEHIFECEHGEIDEFVERSEEFLSLKNERDVKALNCLLSIVQKGDRLDAIEQVSPFYATSSVESFNARAAFYASKDRYYSEDGFQIRTQIAVIDWNSKQKDELEGRRVVVGEKRYYNKTMKQFSTRSVKTEPNYCWRNDILEIASRIRAEEGVVLSDDDDYEEEEMEVHEGDYSFDEHDYDPEDDIVEENEADSLWSRLQLCTDEEYEIETDHLWDQLELVSDDEEENEDKGNLNEEKDD